MKEHMLAPDIHWVGAVDFNLRSFHHYSESHRGTTYNAYFINDEKKVLLDTVSAEFADELLYRLSKHIELEKLDYMVCHHMEKDHSGSLPIIVEKCKPEIIFCSKLGLQSMKGQFDTTGWNIQVVADGETINIGKRTLTFFETRMLHWPDSMVSYCAEDKILFSNDIFGQNIASSSRFVDEVDRAILYQEMKFYYANIVLPYSGQALKAMERLLGLNVPINTIAPDHGLIFRRAEDIAYLLDCYKEFAHQEFKKSALILHDSMWGATAKMAHIIADTLQEEGNIPYVVLDIQRNHPAEIMNALMDASILLVGASTRNNMPMVGTMYTLAHIKGLRPQNKVGAAFGSYGWSGEAPRQLTEALTDLGVHIIADPLRVQYGLSNEHIEECKEFARTLIAGLENLENK